MEIRYWDYFIPEAECVYLLERRFQPDENESHSVDDIRLHLSEKYGIPMFELEPLLHPFADVEHYVNSNLAVSEDRLRFFFEARTGLQFSLAWPLYSALQTCTHYGSLSDQDKLRVLCKVISRILGIPQGELTQLGSMTDLVRYLMAYNCAEDVKWVCTTLHCAIEEYLEELDVILRKATALLLERLPDTSALCRAATAYARDKIGKDPNQVFTHEKFAQEPDQVDVYPCIMNFHGLRWDFVDQKLYFGVLYQQIAALVDKYSDLGGTLVNRLKAIGDKSRLEILRTLKGGKFNGLEISERLKLTPATISHHLTVLTSEGLITASRAGNSVHYNINQNAIQRFLRELEYCLL